jgi:membrane protease YdiL (CAAX protease family)
VKYGVMAASILFGAVHFISPMYILITMIMGFYLGFFFFLTGSLLVPIQIHFVYDLGALVYVRYAYVDNS